MIGFTEVEREMSSTSVKATKNDKFFVAFYVEDRVALLYSEIDVCPAAITAASEA